MARTATTNAVEFGRHERFGGWALGLLVACSVEPGTDQGSRYARTEVAKISASEFARRAGTSQQRIMRFYEAWERAAVKRVVPRASTLTPDDVDAYHLPVGYDWENFFEGSSGPRSVIGQIDQQGPSTVVEKMTPRQRRDMVDALVEQDPDLASRAIARTERLAQPSADPDVVGRRAGSNMARALHTDLATEHLRAAARELAAAEMARREFGVDNPDQEGEALERVDRFRSVYGNGRARWTTDDRGFLDSLGVTV